MAILINSLILTIVNLGTILAGFVVYYISKSGNQIAIQVISACLLSLILFMFWHYISHRYFKRFEIESKLNLVAVYLFSLIWTPIIFTPIHYITQGYLTSWDNINGIWMFQVPTNALILLIYYRYSYLLRIKDMIKKTS